MSRYATTSYGPGCFAYISEFWKYAFTCGLGWFVPSDPHCITCRECGVAGADIPTEDVNESGVIRSLSTGERMLSALCVS